MSGSDTFQTVAVEWKWWHKLKYSFGNASDLHICITLSLAIKLWSIYASWSKFWTEVAHTLSPYALVTLCCCPDPTLSWGKGSGDYWAISWLCWVSSLVFGQANEIVPCHSSIFNPKSILLTQHSKEIAQLAIRPFSSWEGKRWDLGTRLPMPTPQERTN